MNYTVLLLLLLAMVLYVWLVSRYDARRIHRLNRWHVAAFGAMIAVLYLALEPPLEPLADGSFVAHMAQHILLVYVAAPLFLLSAPMMLVLGSLDLAKARRLGRFLRGPLWRSLTFPVFTWLFFMAVMWGAHFSALYQLALTYPAVHILEHALFLFSAILFWQAIIHIGPVSWTMNFPLRVVYVFLAMPQGAFLGLALYQTRMTLYPHYVVTHRGSAAAALADQHAGGALMWIVGGLLLFVVFMVVVAMWGHHERRLGEQLDAQRDARLGCASVLGLALALALFPVSARAGATALDQGERLYQIHCSSCHGATLAGSASAPDLRDVSTDAVEFYLTTGRMPAIGPSEENQHRTPLFAPAQIDALVAFVMSRSRGSTVLPFVDNTGNLVRGRALFIANCSACHGAMAQGGSVGYGWTAPSLDRATVTEVAQAIRIGPGVMPRFDEHTLSDRDVNDIVRYVNVLQTNIPNAGGLPLLGLGATAEGLVAWVLGLGTLIVIIRLIGTNA
jgi:ubiquinol-cytochrome c reductase cytochrome c subunit